MGAGWLEILGTEVLGYRAYGTMEPWAVTITADCGSQGSYQTAASFDHWMGTRRDESGALVWEISSNPNVLEGTYFFASGKEGEGWEYTWRFERGKD